ncbi:MAG: class I SAM-dependent methyltransferase [Cytophagales bacterium]|nr:MAG: class I SAM-dependent methyltransferase [Cytophagales bacterium]
MKDKLSTSEEGQRKDMENYYRFQAKIYDATRWIFLFGRFSVIRKIPVNYKDNLQILDVGCGTGVNSKALALQFPNAHITSIDVSKDMLDRAAEKLKPFGDRITLINEPYQSDTKWNNHFDIILFSYSLTMINPQWSELIEQAKQDLKPNGYIVVADFHDTKMGFYKKFMRSNHVRLDGHLLPFLKQRFRPVYEKVKNGYVAVWQYLMFIGKKEQ